MEYTCGRKTRRKNEARQRQAADEARDQAQREQKAERWGRYRSNIAAASAALQLQNSGAARSALEDAPKEHRNWEWQYLHSQLDGASLVLPVPGGKIRSLVLSPSGRQIAVCCVDHNDVYLYDVATGKLDAVLRGHSAPATSVAYRPDGKQLPPPATTRPSASGIRRRADKPPFSRRKSPHPTWIVTPSWRTTRTAAGLPPMRLRLEIGAGTSRLWDATTGKEIAVLAKWQENGRPRRL